MNLLAKLAEIDERIVQDAFQPMQDAVSTWRAKSDHLLAVICFLLSACLGLWRAALSGVPSGAVYAGCFMALVTAAMLHIYGRLNHDSGAPGLFAAGFPVPLALRFSGVLAVLFSLATLCVGADTRSAALDGAGALIWLMGACFAGCTLRRPTPRRVVALAPVTIS